MSTHERFSIFTNWINDLYCRPPKPDLQSIADSAIQLAENMERQKEILEDLKKHVRILIINFFLRVELNLSVLRNCDQVKHKAVCSAS